MANDGSEATAPLELLVEAAIGYNDTVPIENFVCTIGFVL
jgi:hypothetical protein